MNQADSAATLSTLVPPVPTTSPPTPIPQTQQQQQPQSPHQASRTTTNTNATTGSARQMSKLILRTALQKANSAVLCDSANDVVGAIEAYSEAISLLNRVLTTVEKESDRKRLQEIHDSYSERIRLLNALLPKLDSDELSESSDEGVEQALHPNNDHTASLPALPEPDHHPPATAIQNEHTEGGGGDDDPKSWLSKPAKRNFAGQRGGKGAQTVYTPFIRRMGSSSSLESSLIPLEAKFLGSPYRQEPNSSPWSPTRSAQHSPHSNTDGSISTKDLKLFTSNRSFPKGESPLSPQLPSPVSSKSTPMDSSTGASCRGAKRRSNGSSVDQDGSDLAQQHPSESAPETRRPSVASTDMLPEQPTAHMAAYPQGVILPRHSSRAAAAFLKATAVTESTYPISGDSHLANNDALKRTSSTSTTSSTGTSLDSYTEGELSPTTVQSTISNISFQPSMALPPLHFTKNAKAQRGSKDGVANKLIASLDISSAPVTVRTNSLPPSRTQSLATSPTSLSSSITLSQKRPPSDAMSNASQWLSSSVTSGMRRAVTQTTKKQDTQDSFMTQHRRPSAVLQSTGFVSVRKKSAHRLSRVSLDGTSSVRKTQNEYSAAPLFGMFMKDVMTMKGTDINGSNSVGVAAASDLQGACRRPSQETHDHFGRTVAENRLMYDLTSSTPLKVIFALEQSMEHGAHITPRLFIPKDIWLQPNIRLPSIEIKLTACETLTVDLSRLENWINLDDFVGSLRLLEMLEEAVECLQASLTKKLKHESMDGTSTTQSMSIVSAKDSGVIQEGPTMTKKTQSFMSWGSKLTKSVERMNAFSLTKTEDQYRNYLDALQLLFTKSHVLTNWWRHYTEIKRKDVDNLNVGCDAVLHKLIKVCDLLDLAIGSFIIRDMAIVLNKWLKRSGSWVNE